MVYRNSEPEEVEAVTLQGGEEVWLTDHDYEPGDAHLHPGADALAFDLLIGWSSCRAGARVMIGLADGLTRLYRQHKEVEFVAQMMLLIERMVDTEGRYGRRRDRQFREALTSLDMLADKDYESFKNELASALPFHEELLSWSDDKEAQLTVKRL